MFEISSATLILFVFTLFSVVSGQFVPGGSGPGHGGGPPGQPPSGQPPSGQPPSGHHPGAPNGPGFDPDSLMAVST